MNPLVNVEARQAFPADTLLDENHLLWKGFTSGLNPPPLVEDPARFYRRWILGNKKTTGLNFWARGYCVSTGGLDGAVVRQYIRNPEKHEQQMALDLR